MDIVKQLRKAGIEVIQDKEHFIFGLPNSKQKRIKIKDIEKYLFICLLDYIEEE